VSGLARVSTMTGARTSEEMDLCSLPRATPKHPAATWIIGPIPSAACFRLGQCVGGDASGLADKPGVQGPLTKSTTVGHTNA